MRSRTFYLGALMLGAVVVVACSNPETEKLEHVQRGDQYVAEKRDAFAVVEYANAVKLDPKFGEARLKLAQTYERLNDPQSAFDEYIRAADALPDDRDTQLKTARLLLLANAFEDAKARVAPLLAKNPKDIEARLVQANALAGLRDPDGALAQIEEALKLDPSDSQVFLSLGAVRQQAGDARAAENAFRQAVSLAPDEAGPRLALANFLWSSNRAPESEGEIKRVLMRDAKHLLANRMLAVLYMATKRVGEAEQPLKAIAEVANTGDAKLQLADYYMNTGKRGEAGRILQPLVSDPAVAAGAEARLAALDYADGRRVEAHTRLDGALGRQPTNLQLLLIKTQWLLSENKLDEALTRGKAAVAADAQSAAAHYTLALVYDRRRESSLAANSYAEALRLNPRAAAAQVQLSRLSLVSGDGATALRYAQEARQAAPNSIEARVAFVRSLVTQGNLVRAESEVAELLRGAPNAPVVHVVNGEFLATKKNPTAARAAFEKALEMSPSYLEALSGLTYLDVQAKTPARAIARLEPEVARQPTNAPLLALLARAYAAAADTVKAEQALRRAVAANPAFTPGYAALGQLYIRQQRLSEAQSEFQALAERDPSAAGARTMVGVLLEEQGKLDEAAKAYEATVSRPEKAPVAANNLAFIYAERGTNLDVALQLAQTAKQGLPDDPNVDDTIGWIYYKKDLASLAVGPLEASVKKQPENAEAHYHLGMTYAKLGDRAKAKASLGRALELDGAIGGAEARRTLEQVSQ